MNIYTIRKPEIITDQQMDRYLSKIPMERQDRVGRYIRQEDAIRSLCGSLLIQYVIQKELKEDNVTYSYNKYGKPFINEFPKFHYNISHSHDWVVCATDNIEVGIDIEKIKEIDLGIAKRFFAPIEYAQIERRPSDQQLSCFYEYWTMKESFIKALGKGLSIPLNSFCIREENGEYITIDQQSKVYLFNHIHLDKEYKLAVCSQQKTLDIEIHYLNFSDLDSIENSMYLNIQP